MLLLNLPNVSIDESRFNDAEKVEAMAFGFNDAAEADVEGCESSMVEVDISFDLDEPSVGLASEVFWVASDFEGESEIVPKIELFCIAGDTSSEI